MERNADIDARLDEAIRRVQAGDRNAFSTIVELTVGGLRAYAAFFLRDKSKVDDVLQESFVVIYRSINQFSAGTAFMAWAKAIVRYESLSIVRSNQRKNDAHERYMEELTVLMSEEAEREDERHPLEAKLIALRTCLQTLSVRSRILVQRRYFSGVSVEDLAQEQDSKPAAVSMALHRARLALAGCVEKSR
jgi:RNA polymerase sigma-70 factor (ECF subfamily)